MPSSPRKSPGRRSRSKSPSSRRAKYMDLLSDKNLQMLGLTLVVTALLLWYLMRNTTSWWTHLSPKTPSWGGNEALIILMFVFVIAGAAVATYMCLRCYSGYNTTMISYLLFAWVVLLSLLSVYFLTDKQRKYDEAYITLIGVMVACLVSLYRFYTVCKLDYSVLIPALIAFGASTYLVFWSYYVSTH